MNRIVSSVSLVALTALVAGPAAAQDIERAVSAFKAGNFAESAPLFFAVIEFSDEESDIADAEYGLARSLEGLELYQSALKEYGDIVRVGSDHPFFAEAVEGMLNVAEKLDDEFQAPKVINAMYDDNLSAISKMSGEVTQRIHFMLGKYAYNRGDTREARDFFKTVKEGHKFYPHAQYLLGLIRLGVGRVDNPKPKYDQALEHFENVRAVIPDQTNDNELRLLRDLASMGLARTEYEIAYQYEEGDERRIAGLNRSIFEYKKIPRFSEAWADGLFERAWAHTVNNEYGKALGALHTLGAPYFSDVFYPEADNLRAIVYYYNCQWDRVNEIVEETKAKNGALIEKLEALLESDYGFDEWYALLQKSLEAGPDTKEEGLIPYLVARHISIDPRYVKMNSFLTQLDREADAFASNSALGGDLGREMTTIVVDTRDELLLVVGKYVRTKLADTNTELSDIKTRASLISLETKTAETEWLEQGRAIGGRARTRLPRPFVPDDTFQFWWFDDEYWIDELGYYEYKLKTECFE